MVDWTFHLHEAVGPRSLESPCEPVLKHLSKKRV